MNVVISKKSAFSAKKRPILRRYVFGSQILSVVALFLTAALIELQVVRGQSTNQNISQPIQDRPATYFSLSEPTNYSNRLSVVLKDKLSPSEFDLVMNPLARSPEMDAWARQIMATATNDLQTAKLLFDALVGHSTGMPINSRRYRTAKEVYARWTTPGSTFLCQELGYLYVALGRAAGLRTYSVFVEEDCNGGRNFHACAAVALQGQLVLVDPLYGWFGAPHKKFKVLDDVEAVGVFLSGMEALEPRRVGAKLAPQVFVAQASLFDKLAGERHWKEAERTLATMENLSPKAPMTSYAKAAVAWQAGRKDEAVKFTTEAVEAAPQTAQFHALLGYYLAAQGDFLRARVSYENAVRFSMDVKSAELNRSMIKKIEQLQLQQTSK